LQELQLDLSYLEAIMKVIPIAGFLALFCAFMMFSAIRCLRSSDICSIVQRPFDRPEVLPKMFPRKEEEINRVAKLTMDNFRTTVAKVLATKAGHRTFDNTFGALDIADRQFESVYSVFHTLEMLSPKEKVRNACRQQALMLGSFQIDVLYSKQLFKVLNEYETCRAAGLVDTNLSPEKIYYVQRCLQAFKAEGLALEEQAFARFKQIKKDLVQLCLEFSKNINTVKTKLVFSREELLGVSKNFLEWLEEDGAQNFLVGLDAPSFSEVIENCEVAATRERLYEAYNARAWPENEQLLTSILALRAELAKLLGEPNFATHDIKLMMAQSPDRINAFLDQLMGLAAPKMEQELEELRQDLPDGVELDAFGRFKLSDLAFTREAFRRKNLDLDENLIKEYFPLNSTIEGLFEVYQGLLELDFIIHKNIPLWHDDVKVIEVRDRKNFRVQGFVIIDLHPRDNKYSHACEIPIISTVDRAGEFFPAVCVVVANLPVKSQDRPSLLKLSDVRTFFHEFGHAMHQILGTTQTHYFSGTNVLRDFVETPSQMFEEWLWQPEVLKKITHHYKTGEPIPDEIVERLIANRGFDAGYWIARQVNFARYSLECHSKKDGKVDLQQLWKETYTRTIPGVDEALSLKMHANWGHLTGYSAKYYTYLWSLVFACDLFEFARVLGLESPVAGDKIRELLSSGGSKSPDQLLLDFLNRPPSMEALAVRKGLNAG
jgi:thimet oligopeptidase